MPTAPKSTNREEWLIRAIVPLAALINSETSLVCKPAKVRVSCGWPRSDRNGQVIGQCWPQKSGAGVSHLFITPLLKDPIDVLAVLLHELIHAADDCTSQHAGPFTKAFRAVGFTCKPTAAVCTKGSALHDQLKAIAKELGKYPHAGITPGGGGTIKKQGTRMIKCSCPECGYTVRTTQKWIDVAVPQCPDPTCNIFQCPLDVEQKEEDNPDE